MRAPALRPGDSAGCAGGSGSNLYTGSRHQERTDLWASAAVHHRPVSSGVGQTPPGGQLIPSARSPRSHARAGWRSASGASSTRSAKLSAIMEAISTRSLLPRRASQSRPVWRLCFLARQSSQSAVLLVLRLRRYWVRLGSSAGLAYLIAKGPVELI